MRSNRPVLRNLFNNFYERGALDSYALLYSTLLAI